MSDSHRIKFDNGAQSEKAFGHDEDLARSFVGWTGHTGSFIGGWFLEYGVIAPALIGAGIVAPEILIPIGIVTKFGLSALGGPLFETIYDYTGNLYSGETEAVAMVENDFLEKLEQDSQANLISASYDG